MSKIIVLASFHPKKDKVKEVKEIILSMINLQGQKKVMNFIIFMKKKIKMIKLYLSTYLKFIKILPL